MPTTGSLLPIGPFVEQAVGAIVGATVALFCLTGGAPIFMGALGDFNNALLAADTGSPLADAVAGIMPLLIGVLGVFFLVFGTTMCLLGLRRWVRQEGPLP